MGQAGSLQRGPSLTLIGTRSAYVSRFLAHTLRPDDMLVLDNLTVRKISGLREWLAKRGVQVLFLPSYSPDFSPTTASWFMTQRFGA